MEMLDKRRPMSMLNMALQPRNTHVGVARSYGLTLPYSKRFSELLLLCLGDIHDIVNCNM